MFASDKALPAPPAPPKPRNASVAAQSPAYRSRPSPSGASTSSSFNTARALFDVAKKPEVQRTVVSVSQNPAVRKAAVSAAKNEQVRSAVVTTAQDENARNTIAEMVKRYDTNTSKNASSAYGYGTSNTKELRKTSDPSNSSSSAMYRSEGPSYTSPISPPVVPHRNETSSYAAASSTSSVAFRNETSTNNSNTNSLYPNLSNQTSSFDSGFSPPPRPQPSTVRQSWQPQSSNFTSIHNELASLNLFGQPAKKAPPARPPPPKFTSNRDSMSPSSSPTNEPHAIVKYPYKSAHSDELTCQPNDVVILKKEVDDQWIYALNTRTGESGIVPIVFLNIRIPLVPTQKTSLISNTVSSFENKDAYVRALYDYNSGMAGDLKFAAGDRIRVTGRVNDEWLRGTLGMQEGIFPITFVELLSGSLPTAPAGVQKTDSAWPALSPQQTNTWSMPNPQQTPALPSPPVASPKSLATVTATYDYNSGVPDDLVFYSGDVIEVIEWVNSEWIRGRLRGSTGLVPCTYVSQPTSG